MNLITLSAIPLLMMAQAYTLVITEKDGKTTTIEADDIATMEFLQEEEGKDPETPDYPVTGDLTLKSGEVTSSTVQALITADADMAYYVGIVPRQEYMTDAQLINYVNTQSDAQRKELTGLGDREQEVFFSNLSANTNYIIVAYVASSTDKALKSYVCTSVDLTPGTTGSVFPFAVSEEGGFYDVNKVGDKLRNYNSSWTSDQDMCWACSCAGMLAWWLDDYKRKTGEDYPLTPGVLPEKSACYSTPVMDIFLNACNNLAGSSDAIQWFMSGVEYNTMVNSEDWRFKESYPYWKGGFMGMSTDEMRKYILTNTHAHPSYATPDEYIYSYNVMFSIDADATVDESAKRFSEIFLDALKQGPSYLCFDGHHALTCWGADYKILEDGTPRITYLYIGENSPAGGGTGNAIDKLEHCEISYGYDGKVGRKRNCAQMYLADEGIRTITLLTTILGW